MKEPTGGNPDDTQESALRRRDWILLPTLSLLTICLALLSVELIARRLYTESPPFLQTCVGPIGSAGARATPNSVCWDKKYESQLVEYKFNSCGYRAGMECGSKPPDTYRIVMVGSSIAMGHLMQQERTFAALLPTDLSRRTKRQVELYNQGLVTLHPHHLTLRFNEALAAEPDLILWILTPFDIETELPLPEPPKSPPEPDLWFRLKEAFATKPIPDALRDLLARSQRKLADTPFGTLLLHFLYQSQSQYVKSYLVGGDEMGFLQVLTSAEWQSRLQHFDSDAAKIERQATVAGVPLVAVLVPNRAQAAMISMGEWPADVDPYKLDRALRPIITSYGGTYIDILPDFRNIPNPERYYFPVDGHPNADGHVLISRLLAKALTSGTVPALTVAAQTEVAQRQER